MDKSHLSRINNSRDLGPRHNNMGKLPGSQVFPHPVRTKFGVRQFPGHTFSQRRLHQGVGRGFTRIPRNPFPMTIDPHGPRAKLQGSMDTIPGPDFYNLASSDSDHTIPAADIAAYAASPNSLYMYEQEKHDMQNSINGSLCSPSLSGYSHGKEDFDLKPQYEMNSLDLSLPDSVGNPGTPSSSKFWVKSEMFDPEMSMENCDMSNGPTLAELNMDESLLDEVVSLVNADSAFATATNSALCSKGDNHVSLSSLLCTQSTSVPRATDLQQPVTKLATSCVSQMNLTPPYSQSSVSWAVDSTKVNKPAPTHVSYSVQSTVPSSTVTGTLPVDDKSTLHKLLLRKPVAQVSRSESSMPSQPPQTHSRTGVPTRVKRSATTANLGNRDEDVEEKWKEIEKYIHEKSEDSKASASLRSKRSRHDSGSSAMTSNEDQDSDNDVFSDRDSDLDDDLSDEEGMLSQLSPLEESLMGNGKKKEKQYFWQYNVQSKGPKGTRLRLELDSSDPHHLKNFEDPVFDPNNTQVAGIRHGGKARKGDGNDVQPNPKRLVQIGMQIKRLNRKINEVTSLGESTASARNQSRKEKNKLASRACRLKKKAQHEANKVKLFGLEKEHRQLMEVMVNIKADLKKRLLEKEEITPQQSLVETLEELIKTHLKEMIAGNTTDFVNKVIATYEKGDPSGGLPIRKK
ncbi:CREB3 regulatory factor-like isoform X1 [Haliotis cracherodii]|uniref:CREB3 regulatory factor-like isoform X1 n=3 Tax=Haliotis cracherodii TaxID=6455 RepID=UPI0039E855CD